MMHLAFILISRRVPINRNDVPSNNRRALGLSKAACGCFAHCPDRHVSAQHCWLLGRQSCSRCLPVLIPARRLERKSAAKVQQCAL